MCFHASRAKNKSESHMLQPSKFCRYYVFGQLCFFQRAGKLHPRTGRTHQLRLQAAARGLLMLGDRLYGEPTGEAATAESPMALHAWSLRYRDPETDEPITLTCPVPGLPLWQDWRAELPASPAKVP